MPKLIFAQLKVFFLWLTQSPCKFETPQSECTIANPQLTQNTNTRTRQGAGTDPTGAAGGMWWTESPMAQSLPQSFNSSNVIVSCILISALLHPCIKPEKERALKISHSYRPIVIRVKIALPKHWQRKPWDSWLAWSDVTPGERGSSEATPAARWQPVLHHREMVNPQRAVARGEWPRRGLGPDWRLPRDLACSPGRSYTIEKLSWENSRLKIW